MDHIQLQVDNPLTVLTQDTARQFLGNSTAGDKYKLFMRGVQLAQLDSDYTIIEEQLSATEMIMASKQEAFEELKNMEDEWKTKVKIFQRSAEIEQKVRTYQKHFVWSQVKQQEEVIYMSKWTYLGCCRERSRVRSSPSQDRGSEEGASNPPRRNQQRRLRSPKCSRCTESA